MTTSNGRRLVRLEERLKPPCATCATWPAVECPPDDETPPAYPARCPTCGRQRLLVIGIDCDRL